MSALGHPRRHPARLVRELPATVPFVGPEALERRRGRPFRLRLGANESPFGPSPRAREAMAAAIGRAAWYCDPECHDLRAELAHGAGAEPAQLVVGSGIDDLLGLVVRTFVDRGELAVTSLGAYPTFNYHVEGYGGRLHRVPYRDGRNDLQALAEAAHRSKARLVYLANPDNPTGTWHSAREVAGLLDAMPDGCLLVLDEAYLDFAAEGTTPAVPASDPRLIRLRTFSKAHGLAGARVGYGIAARETIAAFDKVRLHFGVSRIAQAGALASLRDTDYVGWVVGEVARGRLEYQRLAGDLDLPCLPSATNFVAMDCTSPALSQAVVSALGENGVFVRRPPTPPLDRLVRVTVGEAGERADFAEVFREVVSTLRVHVPRDG